MLFRSLLALCLVAAALSAPAGKTANQVLDKVIAAAVDNINAKNWGSSRPLNSHGGSGNTEFSMGVSNGGTAKEDFSITKAVMKGLATLTRSKSATLNAAKSVLSGTIMLEDAEAVASYSLNFAGAGSNKVGKGWYTGSVTEKADKLFADVQINMKDMVPQSIKSYVVRSGHEGLAAVSGLGGEMGVINKAGMRSSLLEAMEKVMSTNIKVMFNNAIKTVKAKYE